MKKLLKMFLDWIQREPNTIPIKFVIMHNEFRRPNLESSYEKAERIRKAMPKNSATEAFNLSEAVQRSEAMDLCNSFVRGIIETLSPKGTKTLVDYARTARCRISELETALKKADARVEELEKVRRPYVPGMPRAGIKACHSEDRQQEFVLRKYQSEKLAVREDILKAFIAKHNIEPEDVEQVEQATSYGWSWYVRKRAPSPSENPPDLKTADRRRGDAILWELHALWNTVKGLCTPDQLASIARIMGHQEGRYAGAMGTRDTLEEIEKVVEKWQSAGIKNALEGASARVAEISGILKSFREAEARIVPKASEKPKAMFNFHYHLARQAAWSKKTFGPGARAKGVVDHIRKELEEIERDPGDLKEWIDVVILALDGAWRSGASPEQIVAALVSKQVKNEARIWPDWRTQDPDKAIEHDRNFDAFACPNCNSKGRHEDWCLLRQGNL